MGNQSSDGSSSKKDSTEWEINHMLVSLRTSGLNLRLTRRENALKSASHSRPSNRIVSKVSKSATRYCKAGKYCQIRIALSTL